VYYPQQREAMFMFDVLHRLFTIDRRAHLEHLAQQAAKIDEMLIAGQITPELRHKLSLVRENLERRIRGILAVLPLEAHG
jgi:hypothetical protein